MTSSADGFRVEAHDQGYKLYSGRHIEYASPLVSRVPRSPAHDANCISDSALSRSLSTTYVYTKWGSQDINADRLHISIALSQTRSDSILPRNRTRNRATIFMHIHVPTCYERNCPCYEHGRPCYEHHAPVMSIMPLLWSSHPCYQPVARIPYGG